MILLKSDKLVKKYSGKLAIQDLNIEIERGKVCAILGPNGSGKTTFMKMAAGLVKPTSGNITYKGKSIGVESKKKVAYMSTEPFFYSYMTIKDVGKYYEDFFKDFDMERYKDLLKRMELELDSKVKSLSSGMASKLKIAVTLARKAELYMLDEPLNGIDIIARDKIIETILEIVNPETTVLISSHLVDELEKIIDYAIFIKKGQLILKGDSKELKETHSKSVVELYKEIYS